MSLPELSYLKYPGGKRKLVPVLREYWTDYRHLRFVELFVGSASVSIGLRPERALLNDKNFHTINLHRWVQKGLKVTLPMIYEKERYYCYRDWFNSLIRYGYSDQPTAAQLYYYLIKSGFNGLVRFNNDGFWNVPMGRYSTVRYEQDFSPWQQVFQNWEFCSCDFAEVPLADDFIYADPPYDSSKEELSPQLSLFPEFNYSKGNGFTGYSGQVFSWLDQVRLAEKLAHHPGPVLISNACTQPIIRLYTRLGFEVREITVARSINVTGDRSPAQEILAWKPPKSDR